MKKQLSEYEQKSWRLVLVCMAAYTTIYIGRKNLSVCLPSMTADGVLSQSLGGIVGTCFLICYAAGQFINGWLGDRIHPSKMVSGGLLFAGLMNIFMGLNSVGVMFCVYWALCGFSCSMLWSPIIRAVSFWTT
ncbi:MAG: MFS transporter, partial [Eubacteriales bacterium]